MAFRWFRWFALTLLTTTGLAVATTAAIPAAAPALMTMDTMDRFFSVDRYADAGRCDFWVVNMTRPTERVERSFDCGFFWDWSRYDGADAYVHEALLDFETGDVFTVPNMARGNMEEWYHVDGHMLTEGALRFTLVDAGVLMPPPHARDRIVMGWVESGGERHGDERVVFPRALEKVGTGDVDGIPTVKWASAFERVRTTWHGYDVYLTEEVSLESDPRTAWILKMERHVVVEMTAAQMAAAFGYAAPPEAEGTPLTHSPRPIMELTYATTANGTREHVDETRFFQTLVTPVERAEAWQAAVVRPFIGGLVLTGVAFAPVGKRRSEE